MPDRLAGIEVFVRAMRHGGLSAAGRELGISPAMAGKHLDALEQRLGVTLVRRTTRQLFLTEAGRQFLSEAERVLAELAEAEADASANTVSVDGRLRVSVPVSFGVMHIAALVPGFSRQYPKLTIELGLNDRYINLAEEEWDVGIRIGRLPDGNLIARKLAPVSTVVCAAPAYIASHGAPATLDDLARHICLGYTLSTNAGTTWKFGATGDIVVPVRGSLHANNGDALIAAAVAGLGIVYGPRFIAAPALRDGRLVEISLQAQLFDIGAVYALTHPDRRPTKKARAWIAYLSDCFGQTPI